MDNFPCGCLAACYVKPHSESVRVSNNRAPGELPILSVSPIRLMGQPGRDYTIEIV